MRYLHLPFFAAIVFISTALSPVLAQEVGPATQVIKTTIEDVRSIVLKEKNTLSKEALDKKLEDIIIPIFNFGEMARRSLGVNWKDATADERQEFVSLFTTLLSRTYLGKIRKVERSEVTYQGESIENDKATVRTKVLDQGDEFPIYYRLQLTDGQWRIFDVVIENVSLVSNYRNEFSSIVRKGKMSGLIEKLREKRDNPPAENKA